MSQFLARSMRYFLAAHLDLVLQKTDRLNAVDLSADGFLAARGVPNAKYSDKKLIL